jgi:translation initiation factor 1
MVEQKSNLVFSTDKKVDTHSKSDSPWTQGVGSTKMRLETNQRGGKAVTVLFNLPMSEIDARQLLKQMQTGFGCGGTLKDSTLELRGDVRQKVEVFFKAKGLKIVRAGGLC